MKRKKVPLVSDSWTPPFFRSATSALFWSPFILLFPLFFDIYQANIMISAFIYMMLGLGLNIVVGLAGLLDLGYVAFYAVGAYSYALLNMHFGLGFWIVLPIGGLWGPSFGVLLGFPVFAFGATTWPSSPWASGRSSGWSWKTGATSPSALQGIANIPRPSFFGMDLSIQDSIITSTSS